MATKVLLCALLGTAMSKPVAEADLRLTRSAEAEAKAEPDADALRPFAYSSPAGAVSFSLGAAAPTVASASPLVSSVGHHSVAHSTLPFTAHQPVAASAVHHAVAPVVASAAPFTAHQPVVASVAHHAVAPAAVVASAAPFTAHQPVASVAHHSVAPVLASSAPFTAHQPVAAVAQHSVASHTPFIAHRQHLAPVAAHHAVAQVGADHPPHRPPAKAWHDRHVCRRKSRFLGNRRLSKSLRVRSRAEGFHRGERGGERGRSGNCRHNDDEVDADAARGVPCRPSLPLLPERQADRDAALPGQGFGSFGIILLLPQYTITHVPDACHRVLSDLDLSGM